MIRKYPSRVINTNVLYSRYQGTNNILQGVVLIEAFYGFPQSLQESAGLVP
jgi:hypothetical protein